MGLNWSGALSGAASGAAAGAPGGWIGAGVGGLAGLVSGLFGGGKKDKFKQVNRFSPEQQQAFEQYWKNPVQNNQTYQAGNQYLQNLLSGDPSAYQQFEAPLMQQFQQQTVPAIAERFAGMGTGAGAGSSSALYNSLGQAGTNLSTNIGALRGQLQMQALPQALQYAQQPYSNMMQGFGVSPYENVYQQGQPGAGDYMAGTLPYALMAGANNQWGGRGSGSSGGNGGMGPVPQWASQNPGMGMPNFDQMNQFGFAY